jgi:diaminopimelate epimerase
MGNPHAVQLVDDVDTAPVAAQGPLIERHPRFPNRVNAGFMQVVEPQPGAPARVRARRRRDAGLRHRRLRRRGGRHPPGPAGPRVDVHTRGGLLTIEWAGGGPPVLMTGPATTVFEGEIELPDNFALTPEAPRTP